MERKKIIALLRKDLLSEMSYKLAFVLNFGGIIFSAFTFFFIGRLFGDRFSPDLGYFGVSYFPYVLLNMALFSYIGVGVGSFASRLRLEQMQGTLESLVQTPTGISTILCSMFLWNIIFATIDLSIYGILGVFLFKIDLSNLNIISVLAVFILSVFSFSSLGIVSAGFVLLYKRGNPIGAVLNAAEGLFGGIYFPITIMPLSMQFISHLLPITYAVNSLQLAVYKGYSLYMLRHELLSLLIFSLILGPLSIIFIKHCFQKARQNGSLSHY